MIKIQFGIIEHFEYDDYVSDEAMQPVYIDDDLYINDWWERLTTMKTFHQNLKNPGFGLDRWGITIIPPASLRTLQDIVLSDKRIHKDPHLVEFAITENKYMIHYGV